jgi:hypothetical protein
MHKTNLSILRWTLGVSGVLLGGAAYQWAQKLTGLGARFSLRSEWWLLVAGFAALALLLLTGWLLSWSRLQARLMTGAQALIRPVLRWRGLGIVVLLFSLGIYPWLIFGPLGDSFTQAFPRLLAYALSLVGGSLSLAACYPRRDPRLLLATGALLPALIHATIVLLQGVSTYPFSLSWSEVSRYYYASLFFSERLYGFHIPPTVLHPSRYLMQALPFLLGDLPLWAHRLWQVILWLAFTALAAALLTRRLALTDGWRRWLFAGWAFLFLLVGPVYYHLLVPVILVLWGFDLAKPRRTWLAVLLASVWAGISRLNWFPVPGMLAATLYLMEKPASLAGWKVGKLAKYPALLPTSQYLVLPVLWVAIGTLTAFGAQSLYVLWSGNDPEQFASSFSSALLWYRLWPNVTYPLGVLTGALLLSLPFWLLIAAQASRQRGWGHTLRWLGIGSILAVLFAGGLLVSVKIGGGSNLHNLDAYLVLLLVVSAGLWGERYAWEAQPRPMPARRRLWEYALLASLAIPLVLTVTTGGRQHFPDPKIVAQTLAELRQKVTQEMARGGRVLFVAERHLIMFGEIPGVPMEPDYETVFLMEMVMGGNQAYLQQLYEDIEGRRFALIVIDPLPDKEQTADRAFSEENNVFLARVAGPLRAAYRTVMFSGEVGVEVLAPRP